MPTGYIAQSGRRLRQYLQRVSVTDQVEHLLVIPHRTGHAGSRMCGAHCQLLSWAENEMILRPADFRYPKLAIKENFLWQDWLPAIPLLLSRPMRLQEGTYLAHRQGNPLLGLLPRENAYFGLRRKHRTLHGDSVRMRRDIVR